MKVIKRGRVRWKKGAWARKGPGLGYTLCRHLKWGEEFDIVSFVKDEEQPNNPKKLWAVLADMTFVAVLYPNGRRGYRRVQILRRRSVESD